MYELIYWPFLPGRGEVVRLVLEEAGAPYDDVARRKEEDGGGVPAVQAHLYGQGAMPGFAPPYLIDDDLKLAQLPAVCAYLADKHRLVADDEGLRHRALQLFLTVCDVFNEVHNIHHPLGSGLYYEDQKVEAKKAAELFIDGRLPKWLDYFESRVDPAHGGWVMGAEHCYVDLALCHMIRGLEYALPNAIAGALSKRPHLVAHATRVEQRPRIAAYLASDRRVPFNNHGIFRHYPELDSD